jgi:hypothetical protein
MNFAILDVLRLRRSNPVRGGLLLESSRWMVTLGRRHNDRPPGVAEKFLTFAQQLRTPTLYNAIRHTKLLDHVVRFGFSASVWRHFERLESLPRPASSWRRHLLLQPGVRPGHESGRPGGGCLLRWRPE